MDLGDPVNREQGEGMCRFFYLPTEHLCGHLFGPCIKKGMLKCSQELEKVSW